MGVTSKNDPIIRLGTRKSALARVQSEQVKATLKTYGVDCELVLIESLGDQDRQTPLYEIETATPGLFTKQLESALLANQIDIAVHSLKDLPTEQPSGLYVAWIPFRVTTTDCLVIHPQAVDNRLPLGIKKGARVGTSSLRREAQMLSKRPDVFVSPIRGNVPTRVQAVREGRFDAVVLASAGIDRLGLGMDGVQAQVLPADDFVPAPGQGALAIEARSFVSQKLKEAFTGMHNLIADRETRIERRVLKELHGGCTLPLGVACSSMASGGFRLKAFLGIATENGDGKRQWRSYHHFDLAESDEEKLVKKTVTFFKEVMQ